MLLLPLCVYPSWSSVEEDSTTYDWTYDHIAVLTAVSPRHQFISIGASDPSSPRVFPSPTYFGFPLPPFPLMDFV